MTVTQVPGQPILMATQKFYSPNDSAAAKIVYYRRMDGVWKCEVLCELPFVHRFGVLERGGRYYLIACTLKSAHAFKNDWTCPGRIWVAPFPEDITQYNADNPLSLTQAISAFDIFEPLYQRLLEVGMRSGSAEETLSELSSTFFDDATMQIDRTLDLIEPLFAAFLTVAIGVTLIAVMLPLVGIMGSIG